MNFVTKFPSLFFAVVCLLCGVGCFPENFTNVADDQLLRAAVVSSDSDNKLSVFFFVNDLNSPDNSIINSLESYQNIQIFIVNLSKCQITREDLGLETLPSTILRKFGRHIVTLFSTDTNTLKHEVNKNINKQKEDKYVQEITDSKEFKPALALADLGGRIIVVYINGEFNKENPKWMLTRDEQLEIMAKWYKSKVMLFKIEIALCPDFEEDFFTNRAQFLQSSFPRTLFRKSKVNRHWLLGYKYEVFYEITGNDQIFENPGSMELTIVNNDRTIVNAVQYAADYEDLKSRIEKAEFDNKLILLYIVNNNKGINFESSVDLLASVYPKIKVIKVDSAICKDVVDDYRDVGKTEIDVFPLFVVRKFGMMKKKINDFDLASLYYYIQKYQDADTDPDDPKETVLSRIVSKFQVLLPKVAGD